MAKYGYEAINKLGKELKGTVEAGSEEEAEGGQETQCLLAEEQMLPSTVWK